MTYTKREPYIICEDLFKIYKIADLEVVALRGLDLTVYRGEVMAIVGASGSGKTTLLNILAGYDTPSAGRVLVGERDLLKMARSEVVEYRRSEVGFIWQQPGRNLFPYLTAMENVELPMMLSGRGTGERHGFASRLLELVGMGPRKNHKPEALSGGEQQRVAICVALANKPPLLLADEPTGELDDETASEVLNTFDNINKELGTTILLVTHDPDISRRVNRVVAIRDGKTSSEVLRRVSFRSDTDARKSEETLQEFQLVDGNGRVQLPKEYLESLGIKERARVVLRNDELIIKPEDSDE